MPEVVHDINSVEYTFEVETNETLLTVQRGRLEFTGEKPGCLTGDCGVCKVILDGKVVNTCVLLAKNLQGNKIKDLTLVNRLYPIQDAFIEAGAVQSKCCTPGMIMSANVLLNKRLFPHEDNINTAIDEKYCRCTGYEKTVEAEKQTSRKMRCESP